MAANLERFFRPWSLFLAEVAPSISTLIKGADEETKRVRWSFVKNLSLFFVCAVATIGVAAMSASQSAGLESGARVWLVKVYLSVVLTMWIAAALALARWLPRLFGVWFLLAALVAAPVATMVLQTTAGINPRFSFWLVITLWTVFAVMGVWNTKKGWALFLFIAGAIWTICGVIGTAGLTSFLPYSQRALGEVTGFHRLLDVRLISTIIFASGVASTSFVSAWKRGLPNVTPVPMRPLPQPKETDSPWVRYILGPFLVVAEVVYELLHAVINIFWLALATVVIFFTRVGEEFADLVNSMRTDRRSASWIATCLLSFFVLVALFYLASISAVSLLSYLQEDGFGDLLVRFLTIAVNTFFGLVLVAVLAWLVLERRDQAVGGAVQGLMFLLAVVFVSGVVMFGLSRIDALGLVSFRLPGPFTVLLLIFVTSGVLFWLYHERFGASEDASNRTD